jgi:hypothetical protein
MDPADFIALLENCPDVPVYRWSSRKGIDTDDVDNGLQP